MLLQTDRTEFPYSYYWDGIGIARFICKRDMVGIGVYKQGRMRPHPNMDFYSNYRFFRTSRILVLASRSGRLSK